MQRIEAARAVNFERDRAADIRNQQRQTEQQLATVNAANDGEMAQAANDGEEGQEPVSFNQQRLREQTQAARRTAKAPATDAAMSSNIFQSLGGGQDDIKDLILLASAVAEFWAVYPPFALLGSYHVRLIGGKGGGARFGGGIMTEPLGLLNDALEKIVMPAGKSASGLIGGGAGAITGGGKSAGGGSNFADLGTGAGGGIADLGDSNMSGLNPGQVVLMLLCDAVLLVGCITASPFLVTILIALGALGGATGAFCSAAPDLCSTIISNLGSTILWLGGS